MDDKYKYKKVMDRLTRSGDDEDTSEREGAQGIWSDLMSGKKGLLTKDGVVVGAEAVKAALTRQAQPHESG